MQRSLLYSFVFLLLGFSCNTASEQNTKAAEAEQKPFNWKNATIYFLLTDRFNNGDLDNDMNFGRKKDGAKLRNFMGGDIKGITQKIKEGYFNKLGVNAIWINPLVEQIHGSVDEGSGKTYGFHGYWTKDWTALDPNFGTEADLKKLVKTAHENGIRIVLDVVLNHTGPVTDIDPVWPEAWVRTEPSCTYQDYESTVSCTLVDNLPDIKTASSTEVSLPPFLVEKWKNEGRYEEEIKELEKFFTANNYPKLPKYYIIKWLVDFIKKYGVDGFRIDTAKHVESSVWGELYTEALKAFKKWKDKNPDDVLDDNDFYMVGEIYGYSIYNGVSYDYDGDTAVNFFKEGFNSMINFSFKYETAEKNIDDVFSTYAGILNEGDLKGYSTLNYLSSHDDGSPFDANRDKPFKTANYLLLAPGAAQIYYGDETARKLNAKAAGDATLRSFMNWEDLSNNKQQNGYKIQDILNHWQKVGKFRQNHLAIGAGKHMKISDSPYIFKRYYNQNEVKDEVFVILAENVSEIDLGQEVKDGTSLKNAYTGEVASVENGIIKFSQESRIYLLEHI